MIFDQTRHKAEFRESQTLWVMLKLLVALGLRSVTNLENSFLSMLCHFEKSIAGQLSSQKSLTFLEPFDFRTENF